MINVIVAFIANPFVIAGLICGFSYFLYTFLLSFYVFTDGNATQTKSEKNTTGIAKKKTITIVKSKKKTLENKWSSKEKQFSNPWLLKSLKGHRGQILNMDFSSNGKYLATCGDDRTVFLWDTKDLKQKDHKSLRVNIEFDHPTLISWSPDGKAFIIYRYQDSKIEVYKLEKKDGFFSHATVALSFPKKHEEEAVGLGISSNGKFILSCSAKTELILWDLRGNVLTHLDTYMMSTHCAKISPCGKFIVASGFSPDAKVWEVIFNKSGEFVEVKRAFDLSGHNSGIFDVAFQLDTSEIATVSKDGTWRLFDINIDYKRGEDPHLKISGKYDLFGEKALIALYQNTVCIAVSDTLYFYSTLTGNLDKTIENIYDEGKITGIAFDSSGEFLLSSGFKHVRVFYNVTGVKNKIHLAKEKLKESQQTSATKERLQLLITDSQKFLDGLSKK